jgi:DNA-binding NarL/FixJ family response regulator
VRVGEKANAASAEGYPPPAPRPRGRHDLTPRQQEVLVLLAAGHSDGEIAARLFMSKKTASVHVATIKGKLGARSRVEIATDAIALGLIDPPLVRHDPTQRRAGVPG